MNDVLVIDYGMGNIRSVCNAIRALGFNPIVGSSAAEIRSVNKIILPGVGAFGDAMARIRKLNLDAILGDVVIGGDKKLLGICLGAQLICDESDEFGLHKGLGWIDARVESFRDRIALNVPHVGWNNVTVVQSSPIFSNIESFDFYFVHSFHLVCKNEADIVGTTEYGVKFPAVVKRGNVTGVQFHPEKSQRSGLLLLKNFLDDSYA